MSTAVEKFVISATLKSLSVPGPDSFYLLRIDSKGKDFWGMDISGRQAKRFDTRDEAETVITTLKPMETRNYCVSPVHDFI